MSANSKSECSCSGKPTLIFSCSGGSDVGGLSDRSARQLTSKGVGKMYCLAGIGGSVKTILETTSAAERIITIDGCPMDCAKKTLEAADFVPTLHIRLNELGFKKGNSPTTDKNIDILCKAVSDRLLTLAS